MNKLKALIFILKNSLVITIFMFILSVLLAMYGHYLTASILSIASFLIILVKLIWSKANVQ